MTTDDTRRVLDLILKLGGSHNGDLPHGLKSWISRALGMDRSFLDHRLDAGEVKGRQLIALASLFGVSPGRFIDAALGGRSTMKLCLPPLRKRDLKPTPLELAAEKAVERDRPGMTAEAIEALIEEAEEQRYVSPLATLGTLEQACTFASPRQVPYLLGAGSSCFRMLHRFQQASRCLLRSRELADAFGDRLAVGDTLQRTVYLVDSMGAPELAIEFARKALEIYARELDLRKMGESLIDQGFCLSKMKRYEECLKINEDAARFHNEMGLRTRVTRWQIKSLALAALDRHQEAKSCIRAAANEGQMTTYLEAKLLWAEGLVLGLEGASQLERAATKLLDPVPIDAALATVDLCAIYLRNDRLFEAHEVARGMTVFVYPFNHVPAALKAIHELILIGQAAEGLTIKRLEDASLAIKKSRARYYQRTRQ